MSSVGAMSGGFFDELEKIAGPVGFYHAAAQRHKQQQLGAKPATPAATPAPTPEPSRMAGAGRTAKRLAIGAGAVGVGAYALGRGLQAGVHERQKKEREEARRASMLQGNPSPYA